MAMYLSGDPLFTIMLLGRWSSGAFLRYIQKQIKHYIRKQVKEFSQGISSKMIKNEKFFTIPTVSKEDPRIPNHPLELSCHTILASALVK
jgi:hypothetical protein